MCVRARRQVYNTEGDFEDFVDTIQRVQIRRSQRPDAAPSAPQAATVRASTASPSHSATRRMSDDAAERQVEVRLLVLTNFAAAKQVTASQLRGLLRLYRANDARLFDAFDNSVDQAELLHSLLALLE